ncbi:DNA-directed RNA polymerases I and III subunit RPAC2 [Alligator mississippiensis]|uniref:DNA-directed RNA polymerases I and III subunit RPAC2 n=1 Tax=Alligator mississippiensis TaxID=8496 RepID=A0A151MSB7_ALLMI|nr:DNA-directed RNA polymerases I and III subunit RPAC2 [Alligator mississippiensis]
MDEDPELERKAVEELLKEAKRGRTRAETMGAMGWLKCPLAATNKRFLINTIKNTLPTQKEPDQESFRLEEEAAILLPAIDTRTGTQRRSTKRDRANDKKG